ncbi:hypothetical protein K432DRAFT_298367 [Lepidopterella palustris CBS 459.81]|uniref:Rhodopsin domain-containing protein n=1 Tax=Lepidopterella palustris CBS 459.81 TaxID=1314670 RepID=A0A8E2JF03_9PEZI|nr:hypothetical protein K432DRAFT_298367 [Lepidopterella palustris CBS 459.81]
MGTIVGAVPPPPGITPSFHGPLNEIQQKVIEVYSITLAIATIALGLRFYTRGWIVRSFGLDDYAVGLAWILSVVSFGLSFRSVHFGFGRHIWDISSSDFAYYLKLLAPVSCVYIWSLTMTKLSILLLYHRLNPNRIFRLCVYAIMFILISYTVADTIVVAAGCSPLDSSKAGCLNTLGLTQSVINITCDVLIMILPLPLVWSLQLPAMQKVFLVLIFAGGSLVVVASSVRVKYVLQLSGNKDVTFVEGSAGIWSAVEVNVGLICNCVVVMKPFFRRHLSGLLGSSGADSAKESPFSGIGSLFSRFKGKQHEARSYRLSSMDRSRHPKDKGTQLQPKSITISTTYDVVRHKANGNFDTESTENIVSSSAQGSMAKVNETV